MPLKKIEREKHTKQALFLCDVSPVSFLGALLKREREARQGRHGDFHVEPGEKASRSALGSVQICRARVVFCVMRSANIGNGGHNPGRKRRRVSSASDRLTGGFVRGFVSGFVRGFVRGSKPESHH